MRISFPNLTRPKKAASRISKTLELPLAVAQRGVASACGYRDWHELEQSHAKDQISALDQELEKTDFVKRQVELVLSFSAATNVRDGDVQFALADSHLTGDRKNTLEDQVAIRLACFRETGLPIVGRRLPGAVGHLKSPGRNGEIVILRQFGQPTHLISEKNCGTAADFEYVSPRVPPNLFLPMRLYLPYGYWTEHDGARVVYSRDYKPLWRLREGHAAERMNPWEWIKYKEHTSLWDGVYAPWDYPHVKAELEMFLYDHSVHRLPILADALPILVHDQSVGSFAEAADALKKRRFVE